MVIFTEMNKANFNMKKLLALLLLFGIVGCASNINGSYESEYKSLTYVSEKDCDWGACVEITNYDLECEEDSWAGTFEKCQVKIIFRTEADSQAWMDIVCMATIGVFNFMNQLTPVSLSDTQTTRHWQFLYEATNGEIAKSYHNFSFDLLSQTNSVIVKAIECGINDLPLSALDSRTNEIFN